MRGTPYRFVDFRGGLNTKAAPYLVDENECRNCLNVVSTVRGSIKKRYGNSTFCSTFTGTPAFITSLFGLNIGATVLIASGGTKLYSISTGGAATDITGAASITSGLRWAFSSAPSSGGQGPLYAINGTDTPKFWTGSGNIADWTATVGSVPNGTIICYYKNRLWIAGVPGNPSRLYFSDLGDPRSWTATNVVDLDPNDGQTITGIGTAGPYLLVFKQSKTFQVYDLNSGANRPLSMSVGCIAPRTVCESPIGTFFLSADQGVFVSNGNSLRNVSDKIKPTLTSLAAAVSGNAAAAFFNDHYYLSVPSAGSRNDGTLDYDTTTDSWWKHSNTSAQFALWRPSSATAMELYSAQDIASPIVDKCYVPSVFQENGVAFSYSFTGPWLAFKQPYLRKRARQIHVDGRGTWDLCLATDFLDAEETIKSNIFSGAGSGAGTLFGGAGSFGVDGLFGDVSPQSDARAYQPGFPVHNVARAFSIEFEGNSSTDAEIDAYTIMITPRKN